MSLPVVILAGGYGTRMSELTQTIPKPMVEVCGAPILLHIMRHYYSYGCNEFIIATGYRSEVIEDFFDRYHNQGRVVSYKREMKSILRTGWQREDWTVTLVDSGLEASTADRIYSVRHFLKSDQFFLTYGDSWGDVDLDALYDQHQANPDTTLTISTVPVAERFGIVKSENGIVKEFAEKTADSEKRVNAGFMVCDRELFLEEGFTGDFSRTILPSLTAKGKVGAFRHDGWWKAVDSVRDLKEFTEYAEGRPELFHV